MDRDIVFIFDQRPPEGDVVIYPRPEGGYYIIGPLVSHDTLSFFLDKAWDCIVETAGAGYAAIFRTIERLLKQCVHQNVLLNQILPQNFDMETFKSYFTISLRKKNPLFFLGMASFFLYYSYFCLFVFIPYCFTLLDYAIICKVGLFWQIAICSFLAFEVQEDALTVLNVVYVHLRGMPYINFILPVDMSRNGRQSL